jgi:hypothetical protein
MSPFFFSISGFGEMFDWHLARIAASVADPLLLSQVKPRPLNRIYSLELRPTSRTKKTDQHRPPIR